MFYFDQSLSLNRQIDELLEEKRKLAINSQKVSDDCEKSQLEVEELRSALANNKNVLEKKTKELQDIRGTYIEIISPKKGLVTWLLVTFRAKIDKNAVINIG